jgi:hypothetical protein
MLIYVCGDSTKDAYVLWNQEKESFTVCSKNQVEERIRNGKYIIGVVETGTLIKITSNPREAYNNYIKTHGHIEDLDIRFENARKYGKTLINI